MKNKAKHSPKHYSRISSKLVSYTCKETLAYSSGNSNHNRRRYVNENFLVATRHHIYESGCVVTQKSYFWFEMIQYMVCLNESHIKLTSRK